MDAESGDSGKGVHALSSRCSHARLAPILPYPTLGVTESVANL